MNTQFQANTVVNQKDILKRFEVEIGPISKSFFMDYRLRVGEMASNKTNKATVLLF